MFFCFCFWRSGSTGSAEGRGDLRHCNVDFGSWKMESAPTQPRQHPENAHLKTQELRIGLWNPWLPDPEQVVKKNRWHVALAQVFHMFVEFEPGKGIRSAPWLVICGAVCSVPGRCRFWHRAPVGRYTWRFDEAVGTNGRRGLTVSNTL